MNFDTELAETVYRVGRQALWRPLDMVEALLASKDPGSVTEPLARSLCAVDFTGKTVVDLGSNIGFYAFLAGICGAREVHALDYGPDIVRIGELLAARHGLERVRFLQTDFYGTLPAEDYDIALMLDIIGHNKVRKGRVDALMDTVMRYSGKELVVNVRPEYDVLSELGIEAEALRGLYPSEHLRGGRLYLLEYLEARHGRSWEIRPLCSKDEMARQDKPAFHFTRKIG